MVSMKLKKPLRKEAAFLMADGEWLLTLISMNRYLLTVSGDNPRMPSTLASSAQRSRQPVTDRARGIVQALLC